MTQAPKVIYHQFTGKFTQVPDPRNPSKMVDDTPIFASYPGVIRGPFKVIKPAKMVQRNGIWECVDNGELEYSNDLYEITKPNGAGWRNQVLKSWHLDVNFGTEWMPRVSYVENALLEKDAKQFHGSRNWFEFVEEPALAVAGAPEPQKAKGK